MPPSRGRTPFQKWYCVFNLLIGQVVFNAVRQLGNTALINGIGTSNKSLGAIVMFTALLMAWPRRLYTADREEVKNKNAFSYRVMRKLFLPVCG